MRLTQPDWRSWAGLIAAPAAWVAHHQAGSDLNFTDCRRGDTTAVVLIGCVALAISVIGGALSYLAWRQAGGSSQSTQATTGRFIALMAIMVSALLSLTILLQISAGFIVPSCFR